MQTMARLQSEIRVRRISLLEENLSVQRQIVQMLDSDRAQSTTFVSRLGLKRVHIA